jgi:hypothetical protein
MTTRALALAVFIILSAISCVVETPIDPPGSLPAVQPLFSIDAIEWKAEPFDSNGEKKWKIEIAFKGKILEPGWVYETVSLGPPMEMKTVQGATFLEQKTKHARIQYVTPIFKAVETDGESEFSNKVALDVPEFIVNKTEWRFGGPSSEEFEGGVRRYVPFSPSSRK